MSGVLKHVLFNVAATIPLLRVWSAQPIGEVDDDALMADAAVGKTEAYAALVRRHHATVRAYCVRASGSQSVGDDLAQDVFLTLWQTRVQYESRGRFRSYLFTLARNACRNQIRGRARGPALLAELPDVPTDTDPLDEMVRSERRRRVHDVVARLPWAQRDALLLRYTADLEYAEIARIVGKPEATIRSRVFLGLSRLRRQLAK